VAAHISSSSSTSSSKNQTKQQQNPLQNEIYRAQFTLCSLKELQGSPASHHTLEWKSGQHSMPHWRTPVPAHGAEPALVCPCSAAARPTTCGPHWPTPPDCSAHWGRLDRAPVPVGTATHIHPLVLHQTKTCIACRGQCHALEQVGKECCRRPVQGLALTPTTCRNHPRDVQEPLSRKDEHCYRYEHVWPHAQVRCTFSQPMQHT
jgi:hypothetical protein